MYEMYDLKEGDWVRLALPKESQFSYGSLKKYDGRVFQIRAIKTVKDGSNNKAYYELENLKSKHGIYYAVLPTWVHRVKAQEDE